VDVIYALPDVLIVILLSVAIKDMISASKNALIVRMGAHHHQYLFGSHFGIPPVFRRYDYMITP